MDAPLLPFVGLALLIVMAPGPDLALVTRSVLRGGRRAGLLTALGIASGSATWAIAAGVGLTAVLTAAPTLLELIRWLGAGYLAWLGIRALLQPAPPVEAPNVVRSGRSWIGPYRVGFISNLLHPGQLVFYTSMLPQFLDGDTDTALQVIRLGLLFAVIVLAWFTGYAMLASRIGIRRGRSLTPFLNRITGLVLIGFAIRLAARL